MGAELFSGSFGQLGAELAESGAESGLEVGGSEVPFEAPGSEFGQGDGGDALAKLDDGATAPQQSPALQKAQPGQAEKPNGFQQLAGQFYDSIKEPIEKNFVVRDPAPEGSPEGTQGEVNYWKSAGKTAAATLTAGVSGGGSGYGNWKQGSNRKKMIDEFQRSQ